MQQQEEQQQPTSASPGDSNTVAGAGNNLNLNHHQHHQEQNSGTHFRDHLGVFNARAPPNSEPGVVSSPRGAQPELPQPVSAPPAHGYANGATPPGPDALGPISNPLDPEAHIHPDLRGRASVGSAQNMMPAGIQPPSASPGPPTAGPSTVTQPQPQPQPQPPSESQSQAQSPQAQQSQHPQQLQPPQHPQQPQQPQQAQVSPSAGPMAVDEAPVDGRKAKRELSQSKRAAQNRAAQRAFRQRKEGYIKKLEQQVRDFMEMEQSFKLLQSENYALREYVIHLQSRLLDAQGEYPQPPPNINLGQPSLAATNVQSPPSGDTGAQPPRPADPGNSTANNAAAGTPLEAVAQAVAGLAAQEQMAERQQYPNKDHRFEPVKQETRDEEEVARQLRENGMPAPPASM